MPAELLVVDPSSPDPARIAAAAGRLAKGLLVGYPTETFYGLGADPRNAEAVERLFVAKGRASAVAIPLLAADRDQVDRAGRLSLLGRRLADRFWPGPLALILEADPSIATPVHAGRGTIAIRISAHPVARALAAQFGGAITATSANLSHEPAVTDARELAFLFGDRIPVVLDGGRTPGGLPSTIVDVTGTEPRLVRAGAVPWERVLEFL
jgi:L-threonylcarbamoyladenylate synthase